MTTIAGEQQAGTRCGRPAAGSALGKSLGIPTAARRRVIGEREEAHPGGDRREAEGDRQEQRDGEEQPRLQEVLEEEGGQAAAQGPVEQDRRVDEGLAAALDPAALPGEEAARATIPPPRISQIDGESPSQCGPSGLGWTNPHEPAFRMPNTIRPRPERRQGGADQIEPGPALGRRVGHPAGEGEDHGHDQDLAHEHVPPGGIGREQAADERAGRDRDRARRGHQTVRPRPIGGGRSWRRRAQRWPEGSAPRRRPRAPTSPAAGPAGSGEIAVMNDPQP